jgi:hypothetical protein
MAQALGHTSVAPSPLMKCRRFINRTNSIPWRLYRTNSPQAFAGLGKLPGPLALLWSVSRPLRSRSKLDGFNLPCQPAFADRPPSGSGWLHEIKFGRLGAAASMGKGLCWLAARHVRRIASQLSDS